MADISIARLSAVLPATELVQVLQNEIERLRLTDEEREAVETSLQAMKYAADELGLSQADCDRMAAALRSLLERHCPVPENQSSQDNTPSTHSNESEVSVRPECAISPPWMARPFWVDPASGWKYGFPKLYDPAQDGDLNAWLVASGYPKHLADQNLPCTFTAKIDSQ